uniref:Proline iminopeptidase n=1 Tax=Cajanus cajan TaxID=3821 RepID=A0A151S112_CAJCA|nr:Proline iminopeptidase [Cajanus cajan]
MPSGDWKVIITVTEKFDNDNPHNTRMKLRFIPNTLYSLPLPSLFIKLPISLSFSHHQTQTISSGTRSLVFRVQSIDNSYLMASQKEFPELNTNLYPQIEPYGTGFLKVSDLHTIYWEQSGNPSGHPVVFIHGGPGGGTSPSNRRFFDPDFYRIILFDQRGAGKSTPHACLEQNTTWDLIDDIEKLREHLEIPEWQVFGGSWGSTLALAYSQSHPDKVTGMILRGIFLLRKKEIDWFYEGGAAAIFPDAWEPFRDLIPESERGCFIDAYKKRLNSDDINTQYAAARAWTKWEMMTAHLLPNEDNIKKGDDDYFSLSVILKFVKLDNPKSSTVYLNKEKNAYIKQAFARIENHYFVNKGFFPSDSFLLDRIDKIRHINTTIVQGRYDVCCPMMSAWDLHKAWPEADFKVVPDAGHSANEPGITAELVAANEKLKNIIKNKGD